ncbi:hypothetical protein [Paractinoplanes rishiriensis]|nr:hypothetical protein [Actinoplanes rishiriensis]
MTEKLGLPAITVVGLGLLAAPRVVLHDLDLIHEGTFVNALFVFVPLLIWIAVAVWRSTNPFVSMLAAGGVYGICLVVGHNLFAPVDGLFLRAAMSVSSIFTGIAVGIVCGAVAWGIRRVLPSSGRRAATPRPAAGPAATPKR